MNKSNTIVKLFVAFLVIFGYFFLTYKLGIFDMIKNMVGSAAPSPDGTYKSVTVDKLFEDLEKNSLVAEDEYKGQYVAVTGYLSRIDTDSIYLLKTNSEYSLDGVYCDFTNDEQKNAVKKMNIGDIITVKGKINKISKTLGCYYLNMTEIPMNNR